MHSVPEKRTYIRSESVVFRKTTEEFGGLSNMASGFALRVCGIYIRTSEALYQACRFPHLPDIQRMIFDESSPMTAKMRSKPYRKDSRSDWQGIRVGIMRWCLRVKLAQNWRSFSRLLLSTGDKPIVEESTKDEFWGAKPHEDGTLHGVNALGRLLMELRALVKSDKQEQLRLVKPPGISNFVLLGRQVEAIDTRPQDSQYAAKDRTETDVQESIQGIFQIAPNEGKVGRPTDSPQGSMPNKQQPPLLERLRRYPEYRYSGVPWLGNIPAHWKQLALWAVSTPRSERNPGKLPLLSVFLDRGVIPYSEGGGQVHAPSLDLSNYQVVHPGDFVLNNQQAWRGSVGVSKYSGIISPAYIVLQLSEELNPVFANSLMRSPRMVDQFVVASKGVGDIQRQIYWPFLKRVQVPIPHKDEQFAIIKFLSHADRSIDRFVRRKLRVISSLNDEKHIVIEEAVTHGLRSDAQLKRSGISWVASIPAHWDALRSKYLFKEVTERSTTGKETRLSMSQKFGLVPTSSLEEKRLVSESYAGGKLCERGDLVLNRLKAHLGVFALAPERGLISPDYTVFRKTREMDARYFELVYRTPACRVELRKRAKGIVQGFWRLYSDDFYDITVPVPPLEEQRQIVKQLEIELSELNASIKRIEREIELILEYRTRLLGDVVTGQLDIREAASSLPEETELIETLSSTVSLDDEERQDALETGVAYE